jgi:hypothetical protein
MPLLDQIQTDMVSAMKARAEARLARCARSATALKAPDRFHEADEHTEPRCSTR